MLSIIPLDHLADESSEELPKPFKLFYSNGEGRGSKERSNLYLQNTKLRIFQSLKEGPSPNYPSMNLRHLLILYVAVTRARPPQEENLTSCQALIGDLKESLAFVHTQKTLSSTPRRLAKKRQLCLCRRDSQRNHQLCGHTTMSLWLIEFQCLGLSQFMKLLMH